MTLIKSKFSREKGLLLSKGLIRSVFTPSKTDAVFYWTGEYDGTSLVNAVDTNVPWVSGTGLDAIYDFSVLNDESYVANNIAVHNCVVGNHGRPGAYGTNHRKTNFDYLFYRMVSIMHLFMSELE